MRLMNKRSAQRLFSSVVSLDRETLSCGSYIAHVCLNRPPVNALNGELICSLRDTLKTLNTDRSCRGLVLASTNPKIFSAGLDVTEMSKDEASVRALWVAFQDAWLELYGSPLVTAAAVQGHAPAGACGVALSCDYRVISPHAKIGLIATKIGVVPPYWFYLTMVQVLGERVTQHAIQKGTLFRGEEAVSCGMVDLVAPSEDVVGCCAEEIRNTLRANDTARRATKLMMRNSALEWMRAHRDADLDEMLSFVRSKGFGQVNTRQGDRK
eukprot:Rmarinus@m.3219